MMTRKPRFVAKAASVETMLRPKLLIVTVLVATMTFEDFILKWLPVSNVVYSFSRLLSELVIYGMFLYVVGVRAIVHGKIHRTRIDIAILGFLAAAMVSIYINDAPLLGSLINLRVLIRYIAVFYVVVNLDLDPREIRSLIMLIVVVGIIQSTIGLLQAFQGGPTPFWLPRATELEIGGYSKEFTVLTGGIEKGAVIGAFGYPVAMALYLIVALICALAFLLDTRNNSWRRITICCLSAAVIASGILLTYSRAALAAAILAIPVMFWITKRTRTLLQAGIAAVVAMVFLVGSFAVGGGQQRVEFVKVRQQYVNPLQNIRLVFSGEYWERTRGARQWVIQEVGGNLVRQASLFGFGPDEATAKAEIVRNAGGTLSKLATYRAFEDVYWVAMLAYYGFGGLGLYLYVLWILFSCARDTARDLSVSRGIASVAFATIVVITIPLTLIVQTFEFRAYGFYFWLLAALMYAEFERAKSARRATLIIGRKSGSSYSAALYPQ